MNNKPGRAEEMDMTYYWYEGLVNDDGTGYGSIRHSIVAASRTEAVNILAAQWRREYGETMPQDWAGGVRGKSVDVAAEMRITDDSGDRDDRPWGYSSDVWSQELID